MDSAWRIVWLRGVLAAGVLLAGGWEQAEAQLLRALENARFELAATVELNRADSAVLADLERVKAHLDAGQWDEAVETLRRLLENAEERLVAVSERRWVGLRDYCHLLLAALPADALELYRSRVDPVAGRWYEEGVAGRDRGLLGRVAEEAFASSWGDDALMALGELALEEGDYQSARWCWERIIPVRPSAEAAWNWPGFPDTDLDLAAVRARLVLVSILEGSWARAGEELAQFTRLHPDSEGRLGGRQVRYAEALGELLAESKVWPPAEPSPDWPTFAGSPARNKVAGELIDIGTVGWRVPLREGPQPRREGVGGKATLSCHPVYAEGLLLWNDPLEISAVDLTTGQAVWGRDSRVIYSDRYGDIAGRLSAQASEDLGVLRSTMTVFEGRLYARMGDPRTGTSATEATLSGSGIGRGHLICLDLPAEGRLMWKISPEVGWAFEGSPVVDGANVYVGMRCGAVPEAHVACFDAQTGRRRWRVLVCSAEAPGQGIVAEQTHNLLTLEGRTLYYNTNLGAVAAISTDGGRIKWVSLYPRAGGGNLAEPAPHWARDLNPCLYDHGRLLVAPADSPRVFALDAGTGQILWQTGTQLEGAVDLLGTTPEYLIAGGDRLYWIGLQGEDRGRVKHVWPESGERPGFGRGILAGNCVLCPTRERVYVFDQETARLKKVFELAVRGASGGNLLVIDGRLVIATGSELICLEPYAGVPNEQSGEMEMGLGGNELPPPSRVPHSVLPPSPTALDPQPSTLSSQPTPRDRR